MENIQVTNSQVSEEILNQLILTGDISKLNDTQRKEYVIALCNRYNLDPLTKPFSIIAFQGKAQVYANKSTTDQIRQVKSLSVKVADSKQIQDIYVVTAEVSDGKRTESSTGAVNIKGLYGDAMANALMKAETKAKRRATLSFMGLAVLDESEIETIKDAKIESLDIEAKSGFLNKPKKIEAEVVNDLSEESFDKDIVEKEIKTPIIESATSEEYQDYFDSVKERIEQCKEVDGLDIIKKEYIHKLRGKELINANALLTQKRTEVTK